MSHSRKELFLLLIFLFINFELKVNTGYFPCAVLKFRLLHSFSQWKQFHIIFVLTAGSFYTLLFQCSCVQHLHFSKIAASSFKLFPSKALKSHVSGIFADTPFVALCTAEVKTRMGKAEVAVETRVASPSNMLSPSSAWLVQTFSGCG